MPRGEPRRPAWAERLDPRERSPLWGEHRARYRFALSEAKGLRVLDAACGNGYGAAMLAEAGASAVAGVDLSDEAIAFARAHYGLAPNRNFLRADLETLPFASQTFDLVTSFETIEHVPRPRAAMQELARVLRTNGTMFVSSPNGAFYPGGHSGNPFHFTEFRVDELAALLEPHFARVMIYGQRLMRQRPGALAYGAGTEPSAPEGEVSGPHELRRWFFRQLPGPLQDLAWRLVHAEPYYPAEHEFALEADRPERFPVIVAVCRRE